LLCDLNLSVTFSKAQLPCSQVKVVGLDYVLIFYAIEYLQGIFRFLLPLIFYAIEYLQGISSILQN
jgi:hypothetical protein